MSEEPAAKAKKVMGVSVPDLAWVEQVQEEIIEPDLPIVDAHHHLWLHPGETYLMPEFVADLDSGHNIVSSVFAECRSMYKKEGPAEWRSLGETEFVTGCAAMAESGVFGERKLCEGFISRVDLSLGDASREIFEKHIEVSGGRFKGIRYTTAWDAHDRIQSHAPAEHYLLDGGVMAGARVMADLGLTLDSWVYHTQLGDIAQLAAELPALTIVLNHTGVPILGGPYRDKHDEVFNDWLAGIKQVAAHDNVFIKLGALPIRKSGDGVDRSLPPTSDETVTAWKPWISECIDAFGPARCIFESNFPVQKLFASYHVTWNAFKKLAASASEDEKRHLFHDAAVAAYRLGA